MTATVRESNSIRTLLDILKKVIPFSGGLVLTTVPRGGLQLAQATRGAEALLKAYNAGFHAEDKLSWQTIVRRKPLRPLDVYDRDEFQSTAYFQEFAEPENLKFTVALPLAAPVFEGYPGVVHLLRSEEQGDFSAADVQKVMTAIHQFDEKRQSARRTRKSGPVAPGRLESEIPEVRLSIVDGKLKPIFGAHGLTGLDGHLREQMLERAKRRMHQINGHGQAADRIQFPDSHGDVWVFRLATFKHYPALGDGAFTFFCLTPAVQDWSQVRPQDFQADAELSRLIPSIKYMQTEFSRGPKLDSISQQVHLSPFHFHRRFTELLGLTPKEFMVDCQVHQAKVELLEGEKELAEIAKDCGFAHQSHFTSRFKQATGLTPTRWRRMANQRQKSSDN